MTKHKKKTPQPHNLKRYKGTVGRFTNRYEDEDDDRSFKAGVNALTRKELRKEKRKLKKMQKNAFSHRQPIPTMGTLEKEREQKVKAEEGKRKKAEKRRKKREERRKKRQAEKEELDKKDEEIRKENDDDDREIKRCEKLLRLNKRKSKTISQGFKNDGLDFLLEVVDSESLKEIYDTGGDAGLEGEGGQDALAHLDTQDDSDEEEMENDPLDEEMDSEDMESDDSSPEELKGMTKAQAKQKEKLVNEILTQLKTKNKDKTGKKKVSFEEDKSEADEHNIDDADALESDEEMKGLESEAEDSDSNEEMLDSDMSGEIEDDHESLPDDEDDDDDDDDELDGTNNEDQFKEDIYGRIRDKEGNVVNSETSSKVSGGAYIPPAKRLAMAKSADEKRRLEIERLKKQLKGLINRLSEANIQPISGQIEEIFLANSRAETAESLTEIVLAACVAGHHIPERLIIEHAMLIALLHGNVGSEVGAMFLQTLAQKFHSLCKQGDKYGDSKEMDNLLLLLGHLFNFKVVHSVLIFDILKKIAEKFNEKDIELILLMLRSVGFGLRKDDPSGLKDLIIDVQNKAATTDTNQFEDPSRVKFMLETISHIKNNNVRKIPNYDPTHMEHLRKVLRNYITKGGLGDGQLRISLADLLLAEQRGKWWLVGSAWQGRDLQPTQHGAERTNMLSIGGVSSQILELARKMRMNTDVRKNIFCVIMTSEDYVDAFEKLLHLGLKNQAEREIIHVIIDICLQEKVYNAFYAYLTQKFCEYDRRFVMTVQFNMWDQFKELSTYKQHRVSNLACLLAHLIATNAQSLSVFKMIEFGDLDKSKVFLMKQTLNKLLLEQPDYVTTEVFTRISPFPQLAVLRDGLKLFMKHFLLKGAKNLDPKVSESLKERIELAEKALNSQDTKMRM